MTDDSESVTYPSVCTDGLYDSADNNTLRCLLWNLPATFIKIKFAAWNIPLLLLIFLISVIGKMKESYRWHILHMSVLYFVLVLYNMGCSYSTYFEAGVCDNFALNTMDGGIKGYLYNVFMNLMDALLWTTYIPLLPFTVSKFIALFLPAVDRIGWLLLLGWDLLFLLFIAAIQACIAFWYSL